MLRTVLFPVLLAVSGIAHSGQIATPLAPSYKLQGQSAADLAAAWWKWAKSSPSSTNPVEDRTGAHCDTNQQGPVWFLAGGYGSSVISRHCDIPAGKHVFFPIINMVYFPGTADSGLTCEEAIQNGKLNNDTALDLFVRIDGVSLQNPKRFRAATSTCFDLLERVPKDQMPYNAYPSATDGYWILLPPLKRGTHTIEFGGKYNNSSEGYGDMVQNIKYVIMVK
jgi:hypothetical protein